MRDRLHDNDKNQKKLHRLKYSRLESNSIHFSITFILSFILIMHVFLFKKSECNKTKSLYMNDRKGKWNSNWKFENVIKCKDFVNEFRAINTSTSMELNGLIDAWARNFMVLMQA